MYRSRRSDKLNNLGDTSLKSTVVAQPSRLLSSVSLPSTSGENCNVPAVVSMSLMDTRGKGDAEIVHGSMENLYHPVNYRSTSRARKGRSKKSRKQMETKTDESVFGKPNNNIVTHFTSMDENQMLYNALDEERKKILLRRAVCSFLYGALRRQSEKIVRLDGQVKIKGQEAAARMILHNLLLNSFRKQEKELELLIHNNNELHKTVENLSLQIRVVRHIQGTEKQRGIEKDHEINALKVKLTQLKDLLDTSQAQLTNVEEESRNAHTEKYMYEEETCKIREEMKIIQEQFEFLNANLELEKNRSTKLTSETFNQKRIISDLKHQIDELTNQSSQWQERARSFESSNYELTNRLKNRERELNTIQATCKTINQELFDGKEQRAILKKQNEVLQSQIRTSYKESSKLKRNILAMKEELEKKLNQNLQLEESINQKTNENRTVCNELMQFKLQNIQKRRAWVNFFGSIFSPFETFLCLFINSSSEPRRGYQRQQQQSDHNEHLLDPRLFTN